MRGVSIELQEGRDRGEMITSLRSQPGIRKPLTQVPALTLKPLDLGSLSNLQSVGLQVG